MSHQCLADAFAPAEAEYRARVMENTWGHLAPMRNKTYRGSITFAIGCYASGDLNPTPLACEFERLDDSPWLYDAVIEFLQDGAREKYEVGCVYRFDGRLRNYVFSGKTVRIL